MVATTVEKRESQQKGHFYFLDSLRGIAAAWVVIFHIQVQSRELIAPLLEKLPPVIRHYLFESTAGVPIFFVLSGFVIAHSFRKPQYSFSYFRNFMVRRFIRLSPPYYVAIVVVLLFAFADSIVRGDHFAFPSTINLFANLLYLQDILGFEHILEPAWTLCIEMQFYLLFCLLLWVAYQIESKYGLSNVLLTVFLSTGLVSCLWALDIIPYERRPHYFLPVWFSFVLGVLTYWAWTKKISPFWLYLYLLLVTVGGIVSGERFALASAITAMTIFAVSITNHQEDYLKWQWLQFLGLVSYSLYLVHPPLISATSFVLTKLLGQPTVLTSIISVIAILAVCIGFSAVIWRISEKPSIELSRSLKSQASPKSVS